MFQFRDGRNCECARVVFSRRTVRSGVARRNSGGGSIGQARLCAKRGERRNQADKRIQRGSAACCTGAGRAKAVPTGRPVRQGSPRYSRGVRKEAVRRLSLFSDNRVTGRHTGRKARSGNACWIGAGTRRLDCKDRIDGGNLMTSRCARRIQEEGDVARPESKGRVRHSGTDTHAQRPWPVGNTAKWRDTPVAHPRCDLSPAELALRRAERPRAAADDRQRHPHGHWVQYVRPAGNRGQCLLRFHQRLGRRALGVPINAHQIQTSWRAVERRGLLVGANPTWQLSLQPVAVGAIEEEPRLGLAL